MPKKQVLSRPFPILVITFACAPFALLCPGCHGNGYGARGWDSLLEAAEQIDDAVAAYCEEHGHAPDTLEELVPQYLESVPIPSWGTGVWLYGGASDSCLWGLDMKYREDRYYTFYWIGDGKFYYDG